MPPTATKAAAPERATLPVAATSSGDIKVIRNASDLAPTTKAFVHPGIYYNSFDLAFMRKKLASKEEPWFSAWEKNKPANAKCTPHPVVDYDSSTKAGGSLYWNGDAVVAHQEALQWALTGNPNNAANAIQILNAWSSTLKSVIRHPQMPGEMVACGIGALNFANAAELLCYGSPEGKSSGWSDADIKQFKGMLRIIYDPMKDFFPGYNGNWDAIMMNGMICSAVFLDDHDMFDHALKHYVEGQPAHGGLPYYIYDTGQCQETARDQLHVQWGLGAFVSICEVAWKQNIDIYGALDNRLLLGLEYTAKYGLGNDVPFDDHGAFRKTIGEKGRGSFAAIWEAPYQHYVYRKGLEMPYTKQILSSPGHRPEGTFTVGIDWGTFTMYKGDEDPQAAKKP